MQHYKEISQDRWKELLSTYDTPCYFYDATVIQERLNQLKYCFGVDTQVFFSLKANPNVSIASWLKTNGANAEVCSSSELETALRAGFSAKQIIFVGPVKSDSVIKRCIELDLYAIIAESENEIIRINQIAKNLDKIAHIGIRINPDFTIDDAPLKMGGRASQFGIDQDYANNAIQLAQKCDNLKLIGLHIYNGTRVLNHVSLGQNIIKIILYFRNLIKTNSLNLEFIDVGGGFGVPYYKDETYLDLYQLKEIIQPHLDTFTKETNVCIIIESGRFLLAESGVFVTKIVDIKTSKNESYLIADGGTNCHMAAVGVGSILRKNFPISLFSRNGEISEQIHCYQIAGPLCTPGDLLARNILLPQAKIGDYIFIKNSGAYGPSASPIYFLSHGHPNEVLIHNEKSFLIKTADDYLSITHNQHLVELV